ncbi:hypothetical protein GCM10010910_02930 [Microbacterium nanhaiense]|uniref:GerMN domain-containing protein n=2 Tax=Microbacterium nanhaiense TaxID=1301026 RepID=A0ABQ2MVJ0_9MICO|nr:hypothetical protein GCM10010910_02930 [Microbacterium nanhaiense]
MGRGHYDCRMTGEKRGRRRRTAVATIALGLAVLLAGCTGDGEAAAFAREFRDDPAVESMELTSHDNQPFTGGVRGDVVVRDTATDGSVSDLVGRIGDYTRANADRMRGRVTLIVDGLKTEVTGDRAVDDAHLRLLLTLRSDDRVRGASIRDAAVGVYGAAADVAIDLARDLPAVVERNTPGEEWLLSVRSEDGAVSLRGDSAILGTGVRLWDVLGSVVPLTGIRVEDTSRIEIALRHESDLPRARAAASELALANDPEVVFASDLVRLGDSDGEDARLLLSRLEEVTRERVVYVWVSDTRMQVAVRNEDDLSALAGPIEAAIPARITEASLVVDGAPDTSVDIRTTGAGQEGSG